MSIKPVACVMLVALILTCAGDTLLPGEAVFIYGCMPGPPAVYRCNQPPRAKCILIASGDNIVFSSRTPWHVE